MIQVAISGALGKMGRAAVETVLDHEALQLVSVLGRQSGVGQDIGLLLGRSSLGIIVTDDWPTALQQVDVCVDMTTPHCVFQNALLMIEAGVRPVIGTTGLTETQLIELDTRLKAKGLCGLVIPNFAIGAVLMMQFAKQAAKYFEHAEIIELHHNRKADAPSGTALKTAQLMAEAKSDHRPFGTDNAPEMETLPGARGSHGPGDIHIHSVRLPGLVAHQEVLLAAPGQLLTLRHDSFDRQCFMPGVVLSIQQVMQRSPGLIYGLEHLI